MAYVKRFDHGTINMDLPYFRYIYQLPLYSFGDTLGNIGVSLVFNYALANEDTNFNFKPGYKLSLQKKLLMQNGKPYALCNEYCKIVGFTKYDNISLRFLTDESQSFVYQEGENFVLENSDLSKVFFDSEGKITSSTDKYGNTILTYSYDATDKLTSVTYRGEKTVSIAYDNLDRINALSYDENNTTFTYTENGINITLCTDEIVILEKLSSDFTAISAELNANNSPVYKSAVKLERNALNRDIEIFEIVYPYKVVDSIKYFYPLYEDDYTANSMVEITDSRGCKKAIQFLGDKKAYTYEIGDNVPFVEWNGYVTYDSSLTIHRFTGTVKLDRHYDDIPIVGVQTLRDGESLLPYDASGRRWVKRVQQSYKDFIISGWAKADTFNNDVTIYYANDFRDIASSTNFFSFACNPVNTWIYFSKVIQLDNEARELCFYLDEANVELKDMRITHYEMELSEGEGDSHLLLSEHGLINHINGSNEFIP